MVEAVGHEHLRTYFTMIRAMLKPGGKAVIQAITQPDERYEAYCRSSDFIRAHIFPGEVMVMVPMCCQVVFLLLVTFFRCLLISIT